MPSRLPAIRPSAVTIARMLRRSMAPILMLSNVTLAAVAMPLAVMIGVL